MATARPLCSTRLCSALALVKSQSIRENGPIEPASHGGGPQAACGEKYAYFLLKGFRRWPQSWVRSKRWLHASARTQARPCSCLRFTSQQEGRKHTLTECPIQAGTSEFTSLCPQRKPVTWTCHPHSTGEEMEAQTLAPVTWGWLGSVSQSSLFFSFS